MAEYTPWISFAYKMFDSCKTSNIETKKEKRTTLRHVGSFKNIDNAEPFLTAEAIECLPRS